MSIFFATRNEPFGNNVEKVDELNLNNDEIDSEKA